MFSGESSKPQALWKGRATSQVDEPAGVGRAPRAPRYVRRPGRRPPPVRPHDRRRARALPKPTTTTSIVSIEANLADVERLDQLHLSPRTKARGRPHHVSISLMGSPWTR